MPFGCIFVPDFPAQAILRGEPVLRPYALAVLEGAPPLETLAAMNEFARAMGVQMDMPRALLEQCSSLVLRRRTPEQEASAQAALLDAAQSVSPRVEKTAADTVLLDLQGMEALYGPPQKIAKVIAERVTALGLQARVAVAANPDAALAAARGFGGVTVIPPGREAAVLGELPLGVLAPDAEILETLERWGIRNFRGLAALPTAQLSERLGQAGVHLQKLARGNFVRALDCHTAPAEFSEAMELEDTVEELEPLSFLLGRLLDDLCRRLKAYAQATNEIRVEFALDISAIAVRRRDAAAGTAKSGENQPFDPLRVPQGKPQPAVTFAKSLRLPVPTCDSKLLLHLLRLSLAATPPQAPIEKVRITALPARPRTAQGGLFVPAGPDPQKLEVTLARIAGIVGAEKVGTPQVLDTHRPGAFQMRHFVADAVAASSAIGEVRPRAAATLRVYRPPVAASVQLQRATPARVAFGGVRGHVQAASGPWRTSGDWWQPDAWQQDVWDIEIALAGSAANARGVYQIYFDYAVNRWFVRGEYD